MDEIEWTSSRLELFHGTLVDEIRTTEKRFSESGDLTLAATRGRRNNILSIFAITLTVILAIYSTKSIPDFWFLIGLSALAISSLITFIIFNKAMTDIAVAFSLVQGAFMEGEGQVNVSRGFVIGKTALLPLIDLNFLKNYFAFSSVLAIVMYVPVIQALEKSIEMKWIGKDLEKILIETMNQFKEQTKGLTLSLDDIDLTLGVHDTTLEFVKNALNECQKFKN